MQLCNGFDEAEAKAAARGAAAAFQAIEALTHLVPLGLGDAGAGIADRNVGLYVG